MPHLSPHVLRAETSRAAARTRRHRLVAATAGLVAVVGVACPAPSAAAVVTSHRIDLSTATAASGTDCPSAPGSYWHFVLTPNRPSNFAFTSMELSIDGTVVAFDTNDILFNGTQRDNVFVRVPVGATLSSLGLVKSTAVYTSVDGDAANRWNLSHTCTVIAPPPPADTSSTTSTTTSSTTSSTTSTTSSTTSSSTTSSVPDTEPDPEVESEGPVPPTDPSTTASSTTTAGSTTTAASDVTIGTSSSVPGDAGATSSTATAASSAAPAPVAAAAAGPVPATANQPTTTAAASLAGSAGTLPTTGGSPWSALATGLIAIALGGALVLVRRRPA